ncbi:MAG: ROK family protein [Terriglobales bacterium]
MSKSVFAADLGGTKLACAVVGADGKIFRQLTEKLQTGSATAPIEQMVRLARELGGPYAAAGVAVPGLARRNGTVWAPNVPGWERMPVARLLEKHLRVPVAVESDRNAVVMGEAWRGAARGKQDVVVLIVGTGIGAGILSGGKLVRGAHELSGCAGWMALGGKETAEFRKRGELETLAAGPAVARAAARMKLKGTTEEIASLARSGDARAKKIFDEVGRVLGLSVANLISLFDPEVVVLTGGLTGAVDLFLEKLEQTARERCQPLVAREVEIRVSRLQAKVNLLGAAKVAWEEQ